MQVTAYKTPVFPEHGDLFAYITEAIPTVPEGAVVVVTSKIVALAEGRTAPMGDAEAKAALIKSESEWALETKYAWLTVKDGMVIASAGVDESNSESGKYILLPKDSFASAAVLRDQLKEHYGVTNLGVILTDSRVLPLRAGVSGAALGYAGFVGIRDYRGKPDMFGRPLKMTQTNLADSLATAAVFLMGEGDERQPLALITDAPLTFTDAVNRDELKIDILDDLYGPFFTHPPKAS